MSYSSVHDFQKGDRVSVEGEIDHVSDGLMWVRVKGATGTVLSEAGDLTMIRPVLTPGDPVSIDDPSSALPPRTATVVGSSGEWVWVLAGGETTPTTVHHRHVTRIDSGPLWRA